MTQPVGSPQTCSSSYKGTPSGNADAEIAEKLNRKMVAGAIIHY